jgi:hypothetical protein
MRTDIEEKVLEKLATGDKPTIVIERQSDGKMRVPSGSWVILRDQVLEVRSVDGRLHMARRARHYCVAFLGGADEFPTHPWYYCPWPQ